MTYLWEVCLKTKLAQVEYIGKFPELSVHGYEKSGNGEYKRTPVEGLDEMVEMLETDKPSTVYYKRNRNTLRFLGPLAFNKSLTKAMP